MDEFFKVFLNQDYAAAARAYEAFAASARKNPQEWENWCGRVEYNNPERWQADPKRCLIYQTIKQIYSLLSAQENPDNQQLIGAISNLLAGSFQYLNGTPESQNPESRLLILKIIVDMLFSCLNDSATVIRWNAYLYNMIVSWNRKNGDDVRAFFGQEAEDLIVKRSYEDIEEKWPVNELLNKQKIADLCDQKAYVRVFRNQLLQLNMNIASQQSPSQTFSSQATGRPVVPVTEMREAAQYSQPQPQQPEQRSSQRLQQNQPGNYEYPQKNYENHEESNEEEEKESPKSPKILIGILIGLCILFLAAFAGALMYAMSSTKKIANQEKTIEQMKSTEQDLKDENTRLSSELEEAKAALEENSESSTEEAAETVDGVPTDETTTGTTADGTSSEDLSNSGAESTDAANADPNSYIVPVEGIPVYKAADINAEKVAELEKGKTYTIISENLPDGTPENWYMVKYNETDAGYLHLYKATEATTVYSTAAAGSALADIQLSEGHYYYIKDSTAYAGWMDLIFDDGQELWIIVQ